MDRAEAQNILQLCRPDNEADRQDPLIAEALAMLETDAELRTWFEEQQTFDADIAAQFETIIPPADLKASILAGMRAHQVHAEPTAAAPETIVQTSQAWWRNPWVGIAALFVIMMVIMSAPGGNQDQQLAVNNPALSGLPPVIPFLSDKIDGLKAWQFDKRNNDAAQLQTYLASTGSPSPSLCDQLANTPTIGCVTFNYNGTKLSMICFKDGEVYHLITADKANFPDTLSTQPEVFELNDKAFKIWVENDQVNILTIHGTKNDIPEFI